MTELNMPPAEFLRLIATASQGLDFTSLASNMAQARDLVKAREQATSPDHPLMAPEFVPFFLFLEQLVVSYYVGTGFAQLLTSKAPEIIKALDAEFCRGCHYYGPDGQCFQFRTPADCC